MSEFNLQNIKIMIKIKKLNILIVLLLLSVSFGFAQDDKPQYKIRLLNECNDELANFGTTFYGDIQMIYSSPKKESKVIKNIWNPNQQPFLELYIADIAEDGELINRVMISKDVNSRYHESNVTFTKDLQTVYFSRDKYYNRHLDKDGNGITHIAMYKADVVFPGVWSNVEEMPFNNKDYCVGHPTLSADDKTLYFSSEMDGSDDIYSISINDDGTYGIPEKLGDQVNTDHSERFPFMGENNILYFSSDKPGGNGKLDIYAVRLDDRSEAINLGKPINSYNDDFSFTKKKGANFGYFSSNRDKGMGDDDIYYFKELNGMPCYQKAEGVVTDKKSGKKIPKALVVLYDADGDELDSQIVGRDAKFSFDVDCESNYKVVGSKELYSKDSKDFVSNSNLKLGLDLNLNIEKEAPKVVEAPIVSVPTPAPTVTTSTYDECQSALDNVNDIYFALDKHNITYRAALELNKVIRIMKHCPSINIEASSHTDCRSSHEYNLALSQRRAKATVDYIINVGNVEAYRITPIGYGETRLRNRCSDGVKCSEAEHKMNRRTQFDITNY